MVEYTVNFGVHIIDRPTWEYLRSPIRAKRQPKHILKMDKLHYLFAHMCTYSGFFLLLFFNINRVKHLCSPYRKAKLSVTFLSVNFLMEKPNLIFGCISSYKVPSPSRLS